MNRTNKYNVRGLWIFAFLMVSILAVIYAAQTEISLLLYVCVITVIILSLGLLILLLQANKELDANIQEINILKHRENAHLKQDQQTTDDHWQQHEVFKTDEILAKIIPAAGAKFDNIAGYTEIILQNIAKEMDIVQGLIFVLNQADQMFHLTGEYAYYSEEQPRSFPMGETLSGQAAKNQKILNLKEIPDGYVTVISGLGKSSPRHLIIAPIIFNDESIGVIELASFKPFGENEELLVKKINESMANLLNELRS